MKVGINFRKFGSIEPFRENIVTIGDNVVLGIGSVVITHCPISFYNGQPVEIIIGNNVYIGAGCAILPGATIGDNVVIGAGSVVTKSIPPNTIAAGNPCRVIRALAPHEAERIKKMTIQNIVADGSLPA